MESTLLPAIVTHSAVVQLPIGLLLTIGSAHFKQPLDGLDSPPDRHLLPSLLKPAREPHPKPAQLQVVAMVCLLPEPMVPLRKQQQNFNFCQQDDC